MPAILGPAEHLSERRPLIVDGVLHEGSQRRMEPHYAAAIGNPTEQRIPQPLILKQHTECVVETHGVELPQILGPEHLNRIARYYLVGAQLLAHLGQRIFGERY